MPNQTALLILGMHRSGTSALTRVVNLLGADLSDRLMPPQPDNERGFWEQDEIVPAHEALLLALGAQWCDPFFLPEGFEKTDAAAPHAARLSEIVKTRFSESKLWALKDPRLSILLPVWKPLLKSLSVKPVYLIALRHPLEVAKSLEKRNAMPTTHACALWLHYTLKSLLETEGETRLLVTYDSLLANWRKVAANIAAAMGKEWPASLEAAAPEVDAFLSADLRHHKQDTPAPDAHYFTTAAIRLYEWLILKDGKDIEDMDMVRNVAHEFEQRTGALRFSSVHANQLLQSAEYKLLAQKERSLQLEQALVSLKSQVEELMQKHAEAWDKVRSEEAHILALSAEIQVQQAQLKRIQSSLSWKLTTPLRAFKRLIFN